MTKIEERFWQYHQANPGIYNLFVHYALEAQASGHAKYSVWALANRVRWHVDIEVNDPNTAFKISNDYLAYYARLIMLEQPALADFFDTKPMQTEPSFVAVNATPAMAVI